MVVFEEPVNSWTDIPKTKLNFQQIIRVLKEIFYIFILMISQREFINDLSKR